MSNDKIQMTNEIQNPNVKYLKPKFYYLEFDI